ncbi:MAG: Hsp20/alpha crystallin family protein [Proteobacteria bacterium]|jgi:HSP20 family protein|nr:Hsp20/alpha crystallin family protein [Desulfocapsa sp.]MBU3946267.1 Hsp20/alpha crystallin family protein [Pseudomonadota bacterium]MCG2742479.1 Hsp20/alpha crystallin family protein [Desulfobacteraceae bacterium]MBU3984266.1 Hsp20/alpha crystallin family protein [Pseudomonadota bacterium]MBU4044422.1 Hsp20/alpha crystallin family protein [Pseudomonadota bacterium]
MFDLLPFKRRSEVPSVFAEMDNMLQKMWYDFPFHKLGEDVDLKWSPRLDVSETDKALEVVADLPGMEKKDINVSVDGDLLTIKGEKKEVKESKDKHFHSIERRSGSFYRALRLPAEVENDKIEANFKDGVLTLTLPKSKKTVKKVAQIEIK